jgi:hypothetical protein
MTPQIFPGLSEPKTQLFFDIQAFIAVNGGRLRLANMIECEQIKKTRYSFCKPKHERKIFHYRKEDDQFIIDNFKDMNLYDISLKLDRSYTSTRMRIYRLQQTGMVGYKKPHPKRNFL